MSGAFVLILSLGFKFMKNTEILGNLCQEIVVTVPCMNFHEGHLVGVVVLHVDRHCKVSSCFS